MKRMWVYILKCSDDSYYTGVTNNLTRRIAEHQRGETECYTSSRLPIELIFSHEFGSPLEAIAAEKQIKGWSRKKKGALIKGDFKLLHELAECKNTTHYKNR